MTIVQEEPMGCGIAAVANIANLSYATVKAKANSMGIFAGDELLYSDTQYVRNLLKEYGFSASTDEMPFQSWSLLPDVALLSIKHKIENNRPFWHWVVFKKSSAGGIVQDSSMQITNHERTDFENMQPKWFIHVSKT